MDRQKKCTNPTALENLTLHIFKKLAGLTIFALKNGDFQTKPRQGFAGRTTSLKGLATTKSLRITALAGYACGLAASAS